ncbi:hypothetical protein VUR80DRAFT_5153 [Thermomyces stellatus]
MNPLPILPSPWRHSSPSTPLLLHHQLLRLAGFDAGVIIPNISLIQTSAHSTPGSGEIGSRPASNLFPFISPAAYRNRRPTRRCPFTFTQTPTWLLQAGSGSLRLLVSTTLRIRCQKPRLQLGL